MSRGPGRVQKIITYLIASDPHGAWSVTELCKHVYPDALIEKKHRISVTRALRKMVLPATWDMHTLSRQGNEYCLYDRCDLESTLRYSCLGWWRDAPIDFATWKDRFPHHIEIAENKVSDACRYRDASPNSRTGEAENPPGQTDSSARRPIFLRRHAGLAPVT